MSDESAPRAHVRTPETDEVLRRIGRNVVTFQQIEQLLKALASVASVAGPASELSIRFEQQAAAVHKKMMGELAGQIRTDLLQCPAQDVVLPDEADEIWFGFRSSIGEDAEFVDRHDVEMRNLVNARNDLVHHFIPRWQSAVDGDAQSALTYLDAQWADAVAMRERLLNWARALYSARRQLSAFLASPDGRQQMGLTLPRDNRLVVMLGEISKLTARADGWALLSVAGNIIKREAPTELEELRKQFGQSNLKGLLLATELFDVVDELTPGGGTRTIYRINARYELQRRQDAVAADKPAS